MSRPWAIDMWWRDVLFAHWPATDELARYLPPGLTLDRFEGTPWLSIVPFRMTDVRGRFAPVLPGFRNVNEINLRTYVTAFGKPGVFFLSLDADSKVLVRSARFATGLPYYDARIATSEAGGTIAYRSERTAPGTRPGRFDARYTPAANGERAVPGSLEAFLHERYAFYGTLRGKLASADVAHEPWTLHAADIAIAENSLGALAGQVLAAPPALCFFARAVRVRATLTLPVRGAAAGASLSGSG
jgi:uncharacterized protein YqjF (DUF2071 family)